MASGHVLAAPRSHYTQGSSAPVLAKAYPEAILNALAQRQRFDPLERIRTLTHVFGVRGERADRTESLSATCAQISPANAGVTPKQTPNAANVGYS